MAWEPALWYLLAGLVIGIILSLPLDWFIWRPRFAEQVRQEEDALKFQLRQREDEVDRLQQQLDEYATGKVAPPGIYVGDELGSSPAGDRVVHVEVRYEADAQSEQPSAEPLGSRIDDTSEQFISAPRPANSPIPDQQSRHHEPALAVSATESASLAAVQRATARKASTQRQDVAEQEMAEQDVADESLPSQVPRSVDDGHSPVGSFIDSMTRRTKAEVETHAEPWRDETINDESVNESVISTTLSVESAADEQQQNAPMPLDEQAREQQTSSGPALHDQRDQDAKEEDIDDERRTLSSEILSLQAHQRQAKNPRLSKLPDEFHLAAHLGRVSDEVRENVSSDIPSTPDRQIEVTREAEEEPPSPLVRVKNVPDDLTKINGIGNTRLHLLYQQNICDFKSLAECTVDDLRQWIKGASVEQREQWISDAKRLAADSPRRYTGPIPDNFDQIPDIGSKRTRTLYEHGIFTFDQLLKTAPDRLERIFAESDEFSQVIEIDSIQAIAQEMIDASSQAEQSRTSDVAMAQRQTQVASDAQSADPTQAEQRTNKKKKKKSRGKNKGKK